MNSIKLDSMARYKECAGKGCQNAGTYYLRVIYLNKFGWFCDDCRDALILDKLIDGSPQSSSSITDQSVERVGQPVRKSPFREVP